jgi:hypothetical protein
MTYNFAQLEDPLFYKCQREKCGCSYKCQRKKMCTWRGATLMGGKAGKMRKATAAQA